MDQPALPPGLASNYFQDHVQVATRLQVRAPSGQFALRPEAGDVMGEDYDSAGHVTAELLKYLMVDTSAQVFLCGSVPFMKALYNGLIDTGFDELQIVYEFIGNVCELRDATPSHVPTETELAPDSLFNVEFRQSEVSANRTPDAVTILELAE